VFDVISFDSSVSEFCLNSALIVQSGLIVCCRAQITSDSKCPYKIEFHVVFVSLTVWWRFFWVKIGNRNEAAKYAKTVRLLVNRELFRHVGSEA